MNRSPLNRLAKPMLVALLVLSCGHPARAEPGSPGVAVVDYDRILQESEPGKKSIAPLDALMKQKKAEAQAMEEELTAIRAKAAQQASTASEKQLAAFQQQFNDKLEDLRRFQAEANNALDKLRTESIGGFNKRSLPVIQALGKERGYSMILEARKLVPIYLDPSADITDLVIQRLNAQGLGER